MSWALVLLDYLPGAEPSIDESLYHGFFFFLAYAVILSLGPVMLSSFPNTRPEQTFWLRSFLVCIALLPAAAIGIALANVISSVFGIMAWTILSAGIGGMALYPRMRVGSLWGLALSLPLGLAIYVVERLIT
jgi:hypothetical protein